MRRLGETTAAFTKEDNRRHDDQCQHHDAALHEVRHAYCQEPADHGVGQHHTQRDDDTNRIVAQTTEVEDAGERTLKQLAARNQAGCRVNREEDNDDDG